MSHLSPQRTLQGFANTANVWSAQSLVKCRYVIAPISFRHRAYHASAISSGSGAPARIWRPLIATDGVWLSRSSPFGERHGCGELAEADAAHDDVRPWRDCDISRLATLLWRCQQSGLAGQVRAIYCIYDLAQCWPDLDQRQEQETMVKSIRLSARRRRRAATHCTEDVMTSNCLIREVGSRTRKQTPAMLICYSSATGRSSFGARRFR